VSEGDDGGKDDEDGSWFSRRFPAAGRTPNPPLIEPGTPAQATPAPPTLPMAPPVFPTTPAAAQASTEDDGFTWGLRPARPAEPDVGRPRAPDVGPPTEPYSPALTEPLPTSPAPTEPLPTSPPPIEPLPTEQPTEAYTVQPWNPAPVAPFEAPAAPAQPTGDAADPASAIDSLFGDHKFQDYEELGVLGTLQAPPAFAATAAGEQREPRAPLSTSQKALMGVAGGLVVLLLMIGLFFLGTRLGSASAAEPTPKPTRESSGVPTPAGTGGPAAPGVESWAALQGGECIQPFSSAWAVTFTVVACTADHDAQMVFKGKLPASSEAKYPTASQFQTELTPLCSASTAINYGAAVAVTDLQVSFSYPPTTASWLSGDRAYYCFVDRVSGGNLPGDLSVPKTQ
jgi:Septum formation